MNKIIILQGPPACGKSTTAELLLEDYGKDKAVIVCRDSIRESCGEYWVPSRESYITDIEVFSVKSALERDLIPIVDATNLNPKTIQRWKDLAAEYKAEIEWIEIVEPYSVALERDSNPDRKRPVGEVVLRNFYTKYYPHMIAPMVEERNMLEFRENKAKAIIVDVDGTIALRNGRHPFDYEKVSEDLPDHRMTDLIRNLIQDCSYTVFFVTGREDIGKCRELTEAWIDKFVHNKKGFDGFFPVENWKLLMRANGDHRSDDKVKKEIWENKIKPWYDVVAVFDDRDKVVKMWREQGLLCLQPYYGDF
jgi:predicted kinase